MPLVPDPKNCDISVKRAIQGLSKKLGYTSSPVFNNINITNVITASSSVFSKTCTIAAGLDVLRVTGLQTDGTAMTGTLRGAYIDVSNGSTAATGTIRGMELKARTEAPGDTGNDVTVLEGLSISADSKDHSVTTMRAAEFILDGSTGGTITEAVGLRIANNLQANKATASYGLQIYRDSFDYTYDITLSLGGHITGDSYVNQDLRTTASPTLGGLTITGLTGVLKATTGVISGNANHSELGTLQGGTTNQYYHLTSAEHTLISAIGALTPTNSNFIVGNGSTWVAESGDTVRTSLGLAIGTDVQAWDAQLDDLATITATAAGIDSHLGGHSDTVLWSEVDKTTSSIADITTKNHTDLTAGDGSDHSFIDQSVVIAGTPTFAGIIIADGGTVGQAAGPLLTFNDTSDYLRLTGARLELAAAAVRYTPAFSIAATYGDTVDCWVQFARARGSDDPILYGYGPNFVVQTARGTLAVPLAVKANDELGGFSFCGHDGTNWQLTGAAFTAVAAEDWTNTNTPADLIFYTTISGAASSPVERMRISDSGAVTMTSTLGVTGAITASNYTAAALLTACATNAGALDFSAASKTLTVENNTIVSQDYSSDASPTFAGLSIGTGELTCGSINRASGTLTIEIGGTAELSITSTTTTFGGNLIIPGDGTIGQVAGPLLTFDDTNDFLEITGCKVGIGTTAPLALFHQQGTSIGLSAAETVNTDTIMLIEGTDAFLELFADDAGTWGSGVVFSETSSGALTDKWSILRKTSGTGDSSLNFSYGAVATPWSNTMMLTMLPGGNVGVNDAAPAEKLDVNGNINTTGVLKIDDVQVVSNQEAHIIDANGTIGDITTKFNTLLSQLETHGLIAAA